MIAALGDLDVGEMAGRQAEPRRGVVRDVAGAGSDINRGTKSEAPVREERRCLPRLRRFGL